MQARERADYRRGAALVGPRVDHSELRDFEWETVACPAARSRACIGDRKSLADW